MSGDWGAAFTVAIALSIAIVLIAGALAKKIGGA